MAAITASFPFKHPSEDRRVKPGETIEVDEAFAREKIADGHAQPAGITDPGPAPSFVGEPQAIVTENAPILDAVPASGATAGPGGTGTGGGAVSTPTDSGSTTHESSTPQAPSVAKAGKGGIK